ncbi:hypothetical protein KIPB_013187, partial [Kipferlia bialata]
VTQTDSQEASTKYLRREVDHLNAHTTASFIVGSVETFVNSDCGTRYLGDMWQQCVTHRASIPFTGWVVMVMRYIEGVTLESLICTHTLRGNAIPETVSIMEQAIRALADLHSAGIVHRDIK